MVTLCHVFGVHRSSYRYWKNRPEKPDGRRAVLRSQVLELHGISHGSAGARSIATMATRRGYQMGRWLAGRLMKELGLVSCQQPTHRYKRGGHEHVAIPNYLERQFAVTYGYRRVWALLRRQAELDGMPAINAKRENLAEAFEHYNEWHPHSALGYRSPREYLRQQASNGLSDNRCLEI
ncbi:HTH-like domain protein [Escherichia coli 2-011-08_S3_C2]|nr:HTH-like domain protein [Escherichia coli 2-011-08_S3_C2]